MKTIIKYFPHSSNSQVGHCKGCPCINGFFIYSRFYTTTKHSLYLTLQRYKWHSVKMRPFKIYVNREEEIICYCYWAKAPPCYGEVDQLFTVYLNNSFQYQYRVLNNGCVERYYIHQVTEQRGCDDGRVPYQRYCTVHHFPSEGLMAEIRDRHEQIRRIKREMLIGAPGHE